MDATQVTSVSQQRVLEEALGRPRHRLALGQSEALHATAVFEMCVLPTVPTAGAVFRVQPGQSEVLSDPGRYM